jgi:hypothetical protein
MMMELATVTGAVNDIVTSSAVLIGGVWAYFKFVRGRTFARRAELDVSVSLENSNSRLYLSIVITLKNTGLSRLPLNSEMKIVRLFHMVSELSDDVCIAEWERISTVSILDQHDWLEAQETVIDTLVYCLSGVDPRSGHAVYQVEALVGAPRRRITGKGTRWQSRAVAFLPLVHSD